MHITILKLFKTSKLKVVSKIKEKNVFNINTMHGSICYQIVNKNSDSNISKKHLMT